MSSPRFGEYLPHLKCDLCDEPGANLAGLCRSCMSEWVVQMREGLGLPPTIEDADALRQLALMFTPEEVRRTG